MHVKCQNDGKQKIKNASFEKYNNNLHLNLKKKCFHY